MSSNTRRIRRSRAIGETRADAVVPIAMLAVAVAAGVAAHLHAGLEPELAAAFGLTLFSLLLLVHVLSRRQPPAPVPREEPFTAEAPGEGEAARRPGPSPVDEEGQQTRLPDVQLDRASQAGSKWAGRQPAPASNPGPPGAEIREPGPAAPPPIPILELEPDREPSADDWRLVEALGSSSIGSTTHEAAGPERRAESTRVPEPADLAPAPALWNFRPGDRHGPAMSQGPGADVRPERSAEIGRRGEAISGESAAIDQILKRLAAQIQSGKEIPVRRDPAGEASTVSAATEAEQAMALESAVDALRSTVDVMRRGDQGAAAKPASKPGAMPEPAGRTGGGQPGEASATPAEVRLAAVAEALARERVDVFLEPILGLADERARHFEVTVRLKTPAGEAIHHAEVEQAGRGAGLLPLLDALRVRHSAGLALRLERRGREGSVFSDMTSESLENRQFLSGVAQSHGHGELIANRLVLAFAQREVRGFTRAQWSALAGLRDLGFRFSLQGVGDLDMDFGVLKATGFEFVKLDAHVFLQGLPLGECIVPASDLCRHMAGSGLALVVGGIDNELDRARIFGFGVLFGQGALFGAPRPISVGGGAAAGVAA